MSKLFKYCRDNRVVPVGVINAAIYPHIAEPFYISEVQLFSQSYKDYSCEVFVTSTGEQRIFLVNIEGEKPVVTETHIKHRKSIA